MYMSNVNTSLQKVIATTVQSWQDSSMTERVYVCFSNDFAIERCLAKSFVGEIIGQGTNIFTKFLGEYFTGEELDDLKIRNDYTGKINWLAAYMETPSDKIATMLLCQDVLMYDSAVEVAFFDRMLDGFRHQWPQLHAKMKDKLEKASNAMQLFGFWETDVFEYLDSADKEAGVVCYLPKSKGQVERMMSNLERMFEFNCVEQDYYDPKKENDRLIDEMLKFKNALIISSERIERLDALEIGKIVTRKNEQVYFYEQCEAHGRKVFVKPVTPATVLKMPRLGPDEEVEEVELREISHEDFEELRAVYLKKGIRVARESAAFGLFSKGKLFGVFGLSTSYTLLNFESMLVSPTIYLMTDFAVKSKKGARLSKLVVTCILSKEVKQVAERLLGKRVRGIVTNAFSENPISMKYRGLFEVLNRKVVETNEEGKPAKYNITYGAEAGQWTLQEGFEQWKQKS